MNHDELLDLIPAYALGALDEAERIELESLLEHDVEAQSLLAEYESVVAMLALSIPQRPAPAYLRDDLKKRLATRQQNTNYQKTMPDNGDTNHSRTLSFPVMWLAGAAALIVGLIGIVFVILNTGNTDTIHPNALLYNEIVARENFYQYTVSPDTATGASGELVVSGDGRQAILRIESLPDTNSDESYQLWLIAEDQVYNGGVFHWADGHGPYYILINRPVEELVALGMTIEPFDGSPLGNAPTGERLFAVAVVSAG